MNDHNDDTRKRTKAAPLEIPPPLEPADGGDAPSASPAKPDDESTRRFLTAIGCDPAHMPGGPPQANAIPPEGGTVTLPRGSRVTVRRGEFPRRSSVAGQTGRKMPGANDDTSSVRMMTVAVAAIDPGTVRHTPQQLADLGASMDNTLHLHPPVLRQRGARYQIVAGVGRVEANRRRGVKEIVATVIPEGPKYDWLAELIRIDENLQRVDPPPVERDRLILRRKQLWEQRHPEAVGSGVLSAAGKKSGAVRTGTCDAASQVRSFVAETARATGKTKRHVQRSLARSEKSIPEVTAAYEHGEISQAQVDELVRLPREAQKAALTKVKGKGRDETRRAVREAQGSSHGIESPVSETPGSSAKAMLRAAEAVIDSLNGPLNQVWCRQADLVTYAAPSDRRRLADRLRRAAATLGRIADALLPVASKPGRQKKPSSDRERR